VLLARQSNRSINFPIRRNIGGGDRRIDGVARTTGGNRARRSSWASGPCAKAKARGYPSLCNLTAIDSGKTVIICNPDAEIATMQARLSRQIQVVAEAARLDAIGCWPGSFAWTGLPTTSR
jgi:hypothetical protein